MTSQLFPDAAPLVGERSDEGYVNKKNEDSRTVFRVNGHFADGRVGSAYVAIVADGVTSTAGGAQASELAITTIEKQLKEQNLPLDDTDSIRDKLHAIIRDTNRIILEMARQTPEHGNMSTTLVVAVVAGHQLIVAHLGDSRAYLVREQQIHRLTLDHTWGQEALDKQRISQVELDTHPNRNVIRRFLGINPTINIDWDIVRPGTYHHDLAHRGIDQDIMIRSDDVILLCSDGLTDKIDEEEILAVVDPLASEPQTAADKLIELALSRREQDNITVVLLSFAQPGTSVATVKRLGWVTAVVALVLLMGLGYFLYGFLQNNEVADGSAVPIEAVAIAQIDAETPTSTAAPVAEPDATGFGVETEVSLIESATKELTIEPTATATATVTPIIKPALTPRGSETNSSPDNIQGSNNTVESETVTQPPRITPTRGSGGVTPTSTDTLTEDELQEVISDTSTPINFPATPTRRPPATPTATATPTASATRAVARAVSTASSAQGTVSAPDDPAQRVQLVAPADDTSSKEQVQFEWNANFELAENQGFELIFWKPGEDPMTAGLGLAGSNRETTALVSPAIAAAQGVSNMPLIWGVRLVQLEPYLPIQYLGGGKRFQFEVSSGTSSSGSSSSNGGSESGGCVGSGCGRD